MKTLLNLLFFIAFLPLSSQQEFYTFDMSAEARHFLNDEGMGFSVGNAWNEIYFEAVIFEGEDFNYNEQPLEIMNSKVTIYGDTTNIGEVILKYPNSQLIVVSRGLSIEEEDLRTYAIYPNPAVNHVMINADVDAMLMYDLNGLLVAQSDSNTMYFNVTDGVYAVLIQKGVKTYSKKLIVKK